MSEIVLTEKLYIISSREDSLKISTTLVYFATKSDVFKRPPELTLRPDWRDRCGLLDTWAEDLEVDKDEMDIPHDIGVWEIAASFATSGSEEQVDKIAYRDLSKCVEDAIFHALQTGIVSPRSPSGEIYYFSLISVPEVEKP